MLKHLLSFLTLIVINIALGQTTTKTVIAQKGYGIFSLLRAHDIPYKYVDSFIKINKEKLVSGRWLEQAEFLG